MKIFKLPVGLREVLAIRIEQLKRLPVGCGDGKNRRTSKTEEKQKHFINEGPNGHHVHRPWRILAFLGLFIFLLSKTFPLARVFNSYAQHSRPARSQWNPGATTEDQYFHLLIPTPTRSIELCRTFLSGSVLQYPAPSTVGWNTNVEQATPDLGGIAEKLENIRKFLSKFGRKRGNDTLLILNNPNSWFQARPEVLLGRYHEALHLDNQKLTRKHGKKVLTAANIKPRILFAADTEGSPLLTAYGRGCYGVKAADDSSRYISPDFIMGSISDLKTIYQEAAAEALSLATAFQPFVWNEHTIFTDMLYEQETRRTTKQTPTSTPKRDLGLTLDLRESLRYHALPNSPDGEWRQDPSGKFRHGGSGLPTDIQLSSPPFWTTQNILPALSWSEVPLLTNTRSHTTPPLLQLSSSNHIDEPRGWFYNLWFSGYARVLLDNYVRMPVVTIAVLELEGRVRRYWGTAQKRGNGRGEWKKGMEFREVCGGQDPQELVFDGKGEWRGAWP